MAKIKIVRTPNVLLRSTEPLISRNAVCDKCKWVSPVISGTQFIHSAYIKHRMSKHKGK